MNKIVLAFGPAQTTLEQDYAVNASVQMVWGYTRAGNVYRSFVGDPGTIRIHEFDANGRLSATISNVVLREGVYNGVGATLVPGGQCLTLASATVSMHP